MSDKGTGDVILRHASGAVLRLDPERYDEASAEHAADAGWEPYTPPKDGFRPRRKRTKAHMRELIRDGIVADPATGGQDHQHYGPDTFVIAVPVGDMQGDARRPG